MDDIREAYWNSKVFVAPLRLGSGLQNKLLEAMATKTPSVTSSLANNALGAKNNIEILIASNPQEFADQIVFLLKNEAEAELLAENALQFVRSTYNWQKSTAELEMVIQQSSKG
jgi:glycosyltransferase involved in cell wall biosynthesis